MIKAIRFLKKVGEVKQREWLLKQIGMSLDALQDGEYALTFNKKDKNRTISQNRLFWIWMACIEHNTGTSKEDCHDYYCSLFLRRHVSIGGMEREVVSGTSGLNTGQFADLLKKIQADAATELSIILPDPKDKYWEEFDKYYSQFI